MSFDSSMSLNMCVCVCVCVYLCIYVVKGLLCHFPGSSAGKESTYKAGDPCLIHGSGRSLEKDRVHTNILGLPWWLKQ